MTTTGLAAIKSMRPLASDTSGFPDTATGLAQALEESRRRTLALMQAWCQALPGLRVPLQPNLNLPLWEWGHVGWFQTWWIGRNRQRALGLRCDPDHERLPPAWAGADDCFNSSTVAHARRWQLELPTLAHIQAELQRGLDETLELLDEAARTGQDLYFWQLVLAHEDMHQEAALYMAQALGLPMPEEWAHGHGHCHGHGHGVPAPECGRPRLEMPAHTLRIGHDPADRCFAFDNEGQAHVVSLPAFEIDAVPITWGEYLAFTRETGHPLPPAVRWLDGQALVRRFASWGPLDLNAPACFLRAADAQAWCDWAGRALPTEAQWECAARTQAGFQWGRVWEWTASTFGPYPGFVPHPYTDYSAPWFGTHRVLRGASEFTSARLLSPSYRNFFLPERGDIPAGFRTVARA